MGAYERTPASSAAATAPSNTQASAPMDVDYQPLDHAGLLASLNGMAHALGRRVVPSEPTDDLTCRVCFANPREICLKPCSHVVLCKPCLQKTMTTPRLRLECPICREPWTMYETVFL